ncbi:MAG: rod shape-determining protein RodA [Lachnospiraceae bacterium]|nr:rod shape-determining protein RodA [Lachnospiraceae bacterium]
MFKNYRLRDYDFKLILYLCAVTVIGILVIGSAQEGYEKRQLVGFIAGLFLMILLSLFDYSVFLKLYWVFYAVTIVLLLLVRFFGHTVNNAKRWVEIAGIQFQPSEAAKILLILFYAQYMMKRREKISSLKNILFMLALLTPPLYLIYKQPDLSTSILIMLVFATLLYVGGLSYRVIFGFLVVAVPIGVIFLTLVLQPDQKIIKDYQQTRILAWLNPEEYSTAEGYQQDNSKMAIGSGQLTGKGLDNQDISSVKNGNFISEPQTDFIFAVVGEELGFVGSMAIVILLLLITLECLMIARKAKDAAGMLIAAGMAALVGFQSFMNIAVATGLMPNTGIPLPFVSYGLTSLLSLYVGMGIVLNIRLQAERKTVSYTELDTL